MSYSKLHQNFGEPRGTSSAVASVLFTRGGDRHEVTKSGSYIYNGDAANFHEWEFRTRLRVKTGGTDPERYADVMSKVVDGLRGDAFIIAKEVGLDRRWYAGNINTARVDDGGRAEAHAERRDFPRGCGKCGRRCSATRCRYSWKPIATRALSEIRRKRRRYGGFRRQRSLRGCEGKAGKPGLRD